MFKVISKQLVLSELPPSSFDRPIEQYPLGAYPPELLPQLQMIPHKLSLLRDSLTRHLTKFVTESPEKYGYGLEDIPTVVNRYLNAFQTGLFHTNGEAFKAMCKELGIKPTERGIANFIYGK